MHPEEITTLYNEMNILRNLDHPNIVKIYEYFEDDKRFYVVTEARKVETRLELNDAVLRQGKFSEKNAAIVM